MTQSLHGIVSGLMNAERIVWLAAIVIVSLRFSCVAILHPSANGDRLMLASRKVSAVRQLD